MVEESKVVMVKKLYIKTKVVTILTVPVSCPRLAHQHGSAAEEQRGRKEINNALKQNKPDLLGKARENRFSFTLSNQG